MIDDDAYLAQLQRIFDANDPGNGIDRFTGYGSEWRVSGLRVVANEDGFDDVDVDIEVNGSGADGPLQVRSQVLFDRQWRSDAGYEDPAVFAPYLVRELDGRIYGLVRDRDSDVAGTLPPAIDGATRDEWWAALLDDLSGEAVVAREVGPGTIEVEQLDEPTTWVHVTSDQWARYVSEHGWDQATEDLATTRSALWEEHTVLFRGRLWCSIRAELPPISQEQDERSKGIPPEEGRMAGGYWVAVDGRGQEHRFPEMLEDEPGGFAGVVRRQFDRLRRRCTDCRTTPGSWSPSCSATCAARSGRSRSRRA
ncbi:hypothetical protein KV097_07265 [Mumia sp. zg.B17]|uniref:hypothetical protein n=1 Tax=Mumia sp. zg.B17 TaxID=2855446 RepID=UPI001C6EAAC6|nr:hypothetical protein [Mumia sp. zg.B17]MBW9205743.1 hypothetical protein [Mumia sp. zg.B17]